MLHISARFLRHFMLFTMVLHFSLKKITPIFGSLQQKNANKRVLKFLRFGAKRVAFSSKMHCYLVQNARLSRAKRKAKCSKTQNYLLQVTSLLGGELW